MTPPKIRALAASRIPSRLASRSGATENEVRPSIERPTSERSWNVVEPGEQRRFLAEIARQRHYLDIGGARRQGARDRDGGIAAAVVDIDDLAAQSARLAQAVEHLADALVQPGQARGLVEQWDDDREARLAGGGRRGGRGNDSARCCPA